MTSLPVNVVPLYPDGTAAHIASRLRNQADEIEAETAEDDRTEMVVTIHLTENGQVSVYALGLADHLRALGLLHRALASIT